MKKFGKTIKIIYWVITIILLAAAVTSATYAWFTNNRTVTTNSATTRTGDESLELQISESGGSSFSSVENAKIIQVNKTSADYLMPVSTNNLSNFVYNKATVDNNAKDFSKVENEDYYYHGRVYLKAVASGMQTGTRMALYLDQGTDGGGDILQAASGQLLAAARLGLVFDNDTSNSVIFRFTDNYSTTDAKGNTFVNNQKLSDGNVLSWNGKGVTSVKDPSVTLDTYTVKIDNSTINLPDKPLLYMDYGKVYQVDLYFYIEGCDPDCSKSLYYDAGNLHLAFYGMLAEG